MTSGSELMTWLVQNGKSHTRNCCKLQLWIWYCAKDCREPRQQESVPHQLTSALKDKRMCVQTILLVWTFSPNFLTEDMAWVYQYNAETKKQSMDLDLKKFKSQKSAAKVMVHVFWDERRVIFMDFYCLVMLNSKQWALYCVTENLSRSHQNKKSL